MDKQTELEILFNNMKSNLTILDKQVQYDCEKYKNALNKQIEDIKKNITLEVKTLESDFSKSITDEFKYTSNLIDSLYADYISRFRKSISEDITLTEVLEQLSKSEAELIKRSKEKCESLFEDFLLTIQNSVEKSSKEMDSALAEKKSILDENFTNHHRQLLANFNNAIEDIGTKTSISLENIEAAEQTSIDNILKLKAISIKEVEKMVENIDIKINACVKEAILNISSQKNNIIADIKKSEIEVRRAVLSELEKSKISLNEKCEESKIDLENKKSLLILDLEQKEKKISEHVDIIKDQLTIELNKTKQEVIVKFTAEISSFLNTMDIREQAIFAKIDKINAKEINEKLEQQKIEKLNEFIPKLNEVIKLYQKEANDLYRDLKASLTHHAEVDMKTSLRKYTDDRKDEVQKFKTDKVDEIEKYTVNKLGQLEEKKDQVQNTMLERILKETKEQIESVWYATHEDLVELFK